MSLHLGNLPPHIRIDELERVFQRFGQCSVRLKDKYGFVVYDYPANAEKALKSLRGKAICGARIPLSWSNKQPHPKPFQRFVKGARSFEPPRGKNFGRHDYVSRDSHHERGYKRGLGPADNDVGRALHAEPVDELTSYYGYEEDRAFVNDILDDSGGGEATAVQNGPLFDRYVPSGADEVNEPDHLSRKENFTTLRIGEEKDKTEHSDAGRDTLSLRLDKDFDKEERSRNSHRSRQGDASFERTTHQSEEKKRRRESHESKRYHSKKVRSSNSACSDHTAFGSRLRSSSLKSLSTSPLDSLPKSSAGRGKSQPSTLRSGSTSRSRSSSPTSQPLFVSPDQSLSSSSDKVRIEQKGLCPKLKVDVLEREPLAKNDACSDNSFKVKDSCVPESYISDPPHMLGETGELQNNDDLTTQHAKDQSQHKDFHNPECSHAANSMKLSSDEVCMILKHYGLEQPKEVKKDSPLEDFFGCARFWPWEIIYYRRHKKGHISTENYARRLAQNKEFGIVDKYVRSSSGWFEV